MAKSDIRLIVQGGVLCAAFSFLALFIPILSALVNYFSLLPIFYVGICLGIRSYLIAISIPLLSSLFLLGPAGIGIFGVTTFIPSIAVLHWHLLKKQGYYVFSATDILHLLSSRFLAITTVGFGCLQLTNSQIFTSLAQKIEVISNLAKIPPSASGSVVNMIPGMFSFLWLLMVWVNFQVAYSIALKSNKSIRKPTIKENIFLPRVWDIMLIGSLWLVIANQLFIDSQLLGIYARTTSCIAAFPLLVEGFEILQLIAINYKIPRYASVIFTILTFLLVWPMIFVVLLGLVEPFYGLKKMYYSK